MATFDLSFLVAQHRQQQMITASALARDLIRYFRVLFTPADIDRSWPELRQGLIALIVEARRSSARSAWSYYRNVRDLSGVAAPFPPVAARPAAVLPPTRPEAASAALRGPGRERRLDEPRDLPREQVEKAVDGAGPNVFKRSIKAGAGAQQATDRAATALAGTGSRFALDGGREVIRDAVEDDSEALGWARVTDADPCSWCAMLASRGAVYKSEQTAGRAKNRQFEGEGAFKWHDHCGCVAVPVFDPDDPVLLRSEDLYNQWLAVTAGKSGKNALNAWRRYWENRDQSGG